MTAAAAMPQINYDGTSSERIIFPRSDRMTIKAIVWSNTFRACRRWTLTAVLALASVLAPHEEVFAQAPYPNRPIRLIVPYPPGGSADPTGRAFGSWLTDKLGVPVVVDNRPGAGATIGHGLAAKAAPDGYTLLLGTSAGLVVSPAFGSKLPYDPLKDFAPVGLAVYVPFLLVVHPSVAAKNVKEFIDIAKAQPGKINFGSPGVGTPNHLGMELLKAVGGIDIVHITYKGGAPAMIDLVSGRIQTLMGGIPYCQPQMTAGKIRAIATAHSQRLRSMPELPAIAETLPGFNTGTWYALLAPAGTPAPIIDKLNAEMKRAIANAEFSRQLDAIGLEPASSTPNELRDLMRSELARWTKVIRAAGIPPPS